MAFDPHTLPLWTALAATLVAAATDLRTRRIPNWLTLSTLATGAVLQTAFWGPRGLLLSFVGMLAAGLPAFALFRLRAMGGGDVKLLAACGALVGPATGLVLLLATAVAGGALAIATVLLRRAWTATAFNFVLLVEHWRQRGWTACPAVSLGASRGITLPYGVAIACGMLFTLVHRLNTP